MWELYDELIDGIPSGLTVLDAAAGYFWVGVQSELGVGVSASARRFFHPFSDRGSMIGRPVREVAERVKSWNMVEASLGLAAINSYYNTPSVAKKSGVPLLSNAHKDDRMNDPYIFYQNAVKGKKVAGVGPSHTLRVMMGGICHLTVLGDTEPGGYPLDACEYLLPEQDFVFLPCVSAATKQLPRLLELCRNAAVIICGPSIPLSPVLFGYGASDLAGFVVRDEEADAAMRIIRAAENRSLFSTGEKVSFKATPAL